jgi:exopolyphosphatase/guanosine-5'-triphosphate,3'-diphosphate pyrophosphatase
VRAEVAAALEEVPALRGPRSLVGVAGTVSTLTGLKLGLIEYDRDALHHQQLTRSDVDALLEQLSEAPLARRRALPGIEPGRADVIVGGAIVLAEVMDVLGHDSLVYSEDDILDGLVASLRPGAHVR